MGGGASKAKRSTETSPELQSGSSVGSAKPKISRSPPANHPAVQAASRTHKPGHSNNNNRSASEQSNTVSSSSNGSPRDTASPGEGRGFNNPQPARRDTIEERASNRQTRMVGAEDMNGTKEELDERPFRQEKVSRVPTKALLKPPKNPNSMIADPDDDYDLY